MNCIRCNARSYGEFCFRCKPRKPIKKESDKALDLRKYIKEVARPYLDKKYGRICNVKLCGSRNMLDVDHILTKGSRPDLKRDLDNMQYLCRPHHIAKTNGVDLELIHSI